MGNGTWKVEIPMEFSSNDIENIIVGAIEGGIGYWAHTIGNTKGENGMPIVADIPDGEALSIHVSNQLQEGKEIYMVDSEGDHFVLTMDLLLNGIKLHHIRRPDTDKENYDAEDYDCIVQLAVFGKLVYG